MKKSYFLNISFFLVTILIFTFPVFSKDLAKPDITPQRLYQRMINKPSFKNNPRGESFCWHAANGMGQLVNMYLATGDTGWLDSGIKYYDFLIDKMDTGPDGYKGWIGPYMYDNKYWCDVHVGDAILLRGILDFSVLVLEDESLKKKYKDKANFYVEIARKHFIEKWDKRGTWKEDGAYGAYISYDKYMEPGNLNEWKYGEEVIKSNLSLPFNKQNDIAQVCIRIYRCTGEKFYFDKAEKIFFRMKNCFQYFDDHYVWNYWEPFGKWDIDIEKKTPRHWVGVHPYRDYQAGEIHQIVDAYHNGIVFDETDIKRIINTNLKVMWNKDKKNPEFNNSNITHTPPNYNNGKTAGTLWTSLLDFDQTIRDLYEVRFKKKTSMSIGKYYYENVIKKNPPGFDRKHTKNNVSVPAVDFTECRDINMAVVMPHIIKKGENAIIMNKSWKPSELEITLYSEDGKNKIKSLYKGSNSTGTGGFSSFFLIEWDGTDTDKMENYKGDYRIRWTIGKDFRECPVTIK